MDLSPSDNQQAIRPAVRAVCAGFGDTYWREFDRKRDLERFVRAATEGLGRTERMVSAVRRIETALKPDSPACTRLKKERPASGGRAARRRGVG